MNEHFVVLCPVCTTTAYRSRSPIAPDGALKPEDFAPLDPSYPLPESGRPLLCPECSATMVVMPESKASKIMESGPSTRVGASSTVEQSAVNREVGGSNPPRRAKTPDTLFAVSEGEEIRDMKDKGSYIVVITNKRIEKVYV